MVAPSLFEQTESSQEAGRAFPDRQARRTIDSDPDSTEQTIAAHLKAIVDWGTSPSTDGAARPRTITEPVLVVNGKNDLMAPTIKSYALFQQLPNARLILYPDSGHVHGRSMLTTTRYRSCRFNTAPAPRPLPRAHRRRHQETR